MGVSPGLIGRFYFMSGNHVVVAFLMAGMAAGIAIGVGKLCRKSNKLSSAMTPVVLAMVIQLFVGGPRLKVVIWFVWVLGMIYAVLAINRFSKKSFHSLAAGGMSNKLNKLVDRDAATFRI